MAWQKVTISIPKDYSPDERIAIGDELLEFIRNRTSKGLDKNNKAFKGYSQSYIKSLNFKNAGKSKNKVNLRLSGDMMASMDVLSQKSGEITIGFENGTEENGKAEGNILGTYGQSSSTGKSRDFLGVTKSDLDEVLSKFPLRDPETREARTEEIIEAIRAGVGSRSRAIRRRLGEDG